MSFASTGTLSFGHTYGRLRAVMQDAWSVVKERSLLSVAPYSFTGMFTSPTAIAPLHRARAMAGPPRESKRRTAGHLTICPSLLTLFKVDLPATGRASSRSAGIDFIGPDADGLA